MTVPRPTGPPPNVARPSPSTRNSLGLTTPSAWPCTTRGTWTGRPPRSARRSNSTRNGPTLTSAWAASCSGRATLEGATRSFSEGFKAEPKLAADLNRQLRYLAACCAARAAAGEGQHIKELPDNERLGLLRQALAWLREDLALYRKLAESAEPSAKQTVRQHLGRWQVDAVLATVRRPAALGRLSDVQGRQWR